MESENHKERIIEATIDTVDPAIPLVTNFGRSMINAYMEAEAKVKAEHPHWFITYPEGKKIDSKRQAKVDSRAKKRHYAIQKKIRESLGGSPQELADNMANNIRVVTGVADMETEVHFLEKMFDKPADDPHSL